MNLDQALATFIAESRDLLADMEASLLAVRGRTDDSGETVNAIFRAAHTIKGSAGLFDLEHVVAFTHRVESVLDRVRDGAITITEPLETLLLGCCDQIGLLVDEIGAGRMTENPDHAAQSQRLSAALLDYLDGGAAIVAPPASSSAEPAAAEPPASAGHWHISLRFGRNVFRNGFDPLSFIRYLSTLGRVASVETMPDALPDLAEMDAETSYLGFEIALESSATKAEIEGTFEFVRDECEIHILPPCSRISEYVQLIAALPEEPARLGEVLVRCGSVTRHELANALATQARGGEHALLGDILVGQRSVQMPVVDAALAKQQQIKDSRAKDGGSIRVDADKLDRLINLVGELIIAAAGANVIARRAHMAELDESTSTLSDLVQEVRDSALQLRMVKIGATFGKFQRVVHDMSRELGKGIELVINGEDTELDKTVVEKIGDPLMHLVRNAIDHGIEASAVRLAAGKPERGTIELDAYHDSGNIVIVVRDDGGGLRRERILAKAIERGLVEPDAALSDDDVYRLIFEPGFSTAEKVSNLSGRGVGMDVVKRNVTALRGGVDVTSTPGAGTTVTVRLPLTLAIIDGFLVEVGTSVFAIPLDMIEECIAFDAEPGHDYTNLRGQVLPFIRLRELFAVEGESTRRENIVVLKHAGQKAGLVVDTLLGEFQTVIKPLGRIFSTLECISGSTILGNGDVALILDVPALVGRCIDSERRTVAQAGARATAVPLVRSHLQSSVAPLVRSTPQESTPC